MTVQLALYKGKGQIGNSAIRWWTGSEYSHCELVVAGKCYSSSLMDGGVREKVIDLSDGKWDLVELPWVTPEQVLQYFKNTDHYSYNWAGLVANQVLNLGRSIKKAQFCSEWCAQALGLPNPSIYNPHTLGETCIFLNKHKVTGG